MNEFLIELQAILNTEISKGNINKSITRLQEQIKKLQLQAEIDPKTILNLKRQIEKATNQSITFSNINLNNGQIEKTGQQIGSSINKGLMASLGSIKNSIYNAIKEFNSNKLSFPDLAKTFNLNRVDINSSVLEQVRGLTKEINALSKEVMKTGSDSSWDNIADKINNLYSVLNQFGKTRDLTPFKESLDILKQFEGKKISVNDKSELFQNTGTGMSVRELNNQFRSLNVSFTTSKKNAVDLDTVWSELCNTSPNLEKFITFGDQINAIVEHLKVAKQALHSDGSLQPMQGNEVSKVLIGYMDRLAEASNKLNLLREQETEIKQNAASTADTVVQNEGRKQQAYKQTADIQQRIIANESLIKSGANVMMFDNTNDAARQASQYFKELLQDEQTLISVSEKFNRANELSSFAVNVKRATGEVETLRYALENIGTKSDPLYVFKNIGASLNDSTAIKQVQKMEKVITDYETKLNDFKTRYSKTNIDFSGFEKVFNNFKNGTGTVNDLKFAFNQLENSAKMGVQSLKSQSASLDPIQQALNNMRDMPSMLKTLETNMSGLQNKTGLVGISVDDLISRYMKLKAEMDAAGGKVPLDGSWAKEYQKLMSDVVASTKRVAAEQKKAEKANQSFFASLKKGLSAFSYWLSPMYLMMQAIAKVKQAFTELKNVNSILTEISKVTEMTASQLRKLGNEAYSAASKYGRTISDYLTGVQEMSRAGFQGSQAAEMAELSVLAQAAGDISTELSNEYLLATNSAYKLNGEVSRLNEILDKQNMVSNRNAVSMEHLANATKVAASQAASSGVAVNEMTAAIGTMVATTQQGGDVAGRAFKAILMNLQQVSGELDDGEIIDEESLTKYEKACNDLGVSLKTVKDGVVSLRDPMQILKELAEVYTSLDEMDARRANLINAIGGKHRGNQLNALLENWSIYEKMLADYASGSGSAMNEAMKSANNWEGSLNRLHNTWVNTVENIANSDAIITIINGANSLLDVLNKLTSKLGSVGTIGIGAFALLNKGRSNDFAL